MSFRTLSVALATVTTLLGACSSLPPARQVTTPNAKHTYVLAGQGSPTVILEAGLGDGKDSWATVFNAIAENTTVFAYDRVGYGGSRSSDASRDGATIVRELRSSLNGLNLQPPYILVGHSIGGTYMELYARHFPDEIAGVVLVDSRHADFTRLCQIANARGCTPPSLLSVLLPSGPEQEMAHGEQTMDQVLHAGPFPDVPLVVLTSGKQFLAGDRFYEVWLETQKSLAALSSQSTHTVCKHCGHYIHKNEPELAIVAVNEIVQQVRRR